MRIPRWVLAVVVLVIAAPGVPAQVAPYEL